MSDSLAGKENMKIHIIGCSGSGKTYFAGKLSEKYHIPHFDLDEIQWDDSAECYGVKRPVEERNAMLLEILAKPEWIIEGVYYAWVKQSFEEADRIYVLDMPKYLYQSRIIGRFLKRKVGFEKGKKETLKSLYALLKWTNTFQNKNMKEIKQLLQPYGNKVVWISDKKTLDGILQGESI